MLEDTDSVFTSATVARMDAGSGHGACNTSISCHPDGGDDGPFAGSSEWRYLVSNEIIATGAGPTGALCLKTILYEDPATGLLERPPSHS